MKLRIASIVSGLIIAQSTFSGLAFAREAERGDDRGHHAQVERHGQAQPGDLRGRGAEGERRGQPQPGDDRGGHHDDPKGHR